MAADCGTLLRKQSEQLTAESGVGASSMWTMRANWLIKKDLCDSECEGRGRDEGRTRRTDGTADSDCVDPRLRLRLASSRRDGSGETPAITSSRRQEGHDADLLYNAEACSNFKLNDSSL